MTQPIHHERKIKSTDGKWISVVFRGEHHMSADHIEFVMSIPILGVKRFFTTNGSVFFNQQNKCFYMHDSSFIIRVDTKTWVASHFISPDKVSFGSNMNSETDLHMSLYSTGSGAREKYQLNLNNIFSSQA